MTDRTMCLKLARALWPSVTGLKLVTVALDGGYASWIEAPGSRYCGFILKDGVSSRSDTRSGAVTNLLAKLNWRASAREERLGAALVAVADVLRARRT